MTLRFDQEDKMIHDSPPALACEPGDVEEPMPRFRRRPKWLIVDDESRPVAELCWAPNEWRLFGSEPLPVANQPAPPFVHLINSCPGQSHVPDREDDPPQKIRQWALDILSLKPTYKWTGHHLGFPDPEDDDSSEKPLSPGDDIILIKP